MNSKQHIPQSLDSALQTLSTGLTEQQRQQLQTALQIPIPESDINRPSGLTIALILKTLAVDAATLIAAILSEPRLRDTPDQAQIELQFGSSVANLVSNVHWLNTLQVYQPELAAQQNQAEILRRMLLASIDDVRAVVIKLAFRLQRLRDLPKESVEMRQFISRETLDIYAPLANRLGIAQLKWELEDLAFRYLEPQQYKQISTSLQESRHERELYINEFTDVLRDLLQQQHIPVKILGRPKHIYSIWKKMQRKDAGFNDLYDLRAVRVIVDNLATCYTVLGLIHAQWQYVPGEFDDYIANAKPNGYQSLHTVVVGPHERMVEIQIRTKEMDDFAELGVAAHWRYKEGGQADNKAEQTVTALRQLLEKTSSDDYPNATSSTENSQSLIEDFQAELYSDRVFVMTPRGELKDLLKGATALDFAYTIHSEIGHRCTGAKVDGRIVPLNYQLKTGQHVEILTSKSSTPKRSWLEHGSGYLQTQHARSKVRHWFRELDHDRNLADGKTLLDKIRQRLDLPKAISESLVNHFHLSHEEELLICVGRADISEKQLLDALNKLNKTTQTDDAQNDYQSPKYAPRPSNEKALAANEISVQGVDNLLTHIAQCCKPVPGDAISGYLTLNRGITIHRQDCSAMTRLTEQHKDRLVQANWGTQAQQYPAEIQIYALQSNDLLKSIIQILANDNIRVLNINSITHDDKQTVSIHLILEITNVEQLNTTLSRLKSIRHIIDAHRHT